MEFNTLPIAESWSWWNRPVPDTVRRILALPEALHDSLCLVIQGVRRCGKSTLLQQLISRYGLNSEHCAFLNFEDPRLAGRLHHDVLSLLSEQFHALHPGVEGLTFFLDEIQWVEGWERWLASRLDRPCGDRYVITGSNARLLSGELSTMLTGRHLTVELHPFDFDEYLALRPEADFVTYLREGGFPEPLKIGDSDRLLRQYFLDITERDIRERLSARSSRPIRQVLQMAFESAGSELSLRRISAACGVAVDTAASYLEAAESAYLLFACPYFAFSERKRARRNKKYYPVDTALRRVVCTRAGADRGKALECFVHQALRRRFDQVAYWREGGEVDFVVMRDGRPLPIQVSWDDPGERHLRALDAFYERFPQAEEAVFLTAANLPAALAELTP